MKFFVDTADVDEIKDLASTGLVDGVTTNPSIIAKSGRNFIEVIAEICDIVDGPVSAEVAATDHETMLAEGRKLAQIAENVAVKVPLTPDGLKTCKALSDAGTKVNVTLCFSFDTEVLVASVRSPMHVVESARMGADVVTLPPSVLRQLFKHPLTDSGLEAFLSDWANSGQSILGS